MHWRRHRKKGPPEATARLPWGNAWDRHLFPDTHARTHTRPQSDLEPPQRAPHTSSLRQPLTLRARADLRHRPPHGGHRGDSLRWIFSSDSTPVTALQRRETWLHRAEGSAAARAPPSTQGTTATGCGTALRLQGKEVTKVAASAELRELFLQPRRGRLGEGRSSDASAVGGSPERELRRSFRREAG